MLVFATQTKKKEKKRNPIAESQDDISEAWWEVWALLETPEHYISQLLVLLSDF